MIIAIETTRRPEASFSPISHHSPPLSKMVLPLNASVLLQTREKKRVNKFGGKEKTHTEMRARYKQ